MFSGPVRRSRALTLCTFALGASTATRTALAQQQILLTDSAAAAPAVRVGPPASFWSRVTVAGEWAHLGAGPVSRPDDPHTATRSLVGTASVALGSVTAPRMRLDLGWLRGVRSPSTSQGVTAGASLPMSVLGGHAHLYPGIAAVAGWSESQDATYGYEWRGVAGTAAAGQFGVHTTPTILRSTMTGFGLHIVGDVPLTRGLALSGSLRQWAFRGRAAADSHMLLAGVGVAFRPWAARHTVEGTR